MAKQQRPSVKTEIFRGSYVALAVPKKNVDDNGKETENYQIFIPLKKTDASTKKTIAELLNIIKIASGEKHGTPLGPKQLKHFPIKDGDGPDMPEQFNGYWCINAKANFKPNVVDIAGNVLQSTEEIYSGAWYKAKLSCYAWINKKGGNGVSINIESAIKIKDDEKFGGGSSAADDFAEDIDPNAKTGKDDDGLDGLGDNGLGL